MNRCKRETSARKGTVLICVLACLGIVMALVLATVQSSLRARNAVRMQRQLLQTDLLCQAGVKRAVQQRNRSSLYLGETWRPTSIDASFGHAVIEIRVEPSIVDANNLQVEVVASLASSADGNDRMQRSHTFSILSATSPSPREGRAQRGEGGEGGELGNTALALHPPRPKDRLSQREGDSLCSQQLLVASIASTSLSENK